MDELAVKYTDYSYLTKKGLSRALGTTLVDSIWQRITSYRQQYSKNLSLRTIDRNNFHLTLTPFIEDRIKAFEKKLTLLKQEYAKLSSIPEQKRIIDNQAKLVCLEAAAKIEGKNISEYTLKAMLSGMYRENDPSHQIFLGYRDVLNNLVAFSSNQDGLSKLDATLNGRNPAMEYGLRLRQSDPKSIFTTVIVGRDYDYAPFAMLDSLMANLWSFLSIDSASNFVKAIATLYYFDYIQPFDGHSCLVGCAFAKALLQEEIEEVAALLPFEAVPLKLNPNYKEFALECQRSADLTYVLLYAIDVLTPMIDSLLDSFVKAYGQLVKEEVASLPPEEFPEEVESIEQPVPIVKEEPVIEEIKVEEKVVYQETPAPISKPAPEAEHIYVHPKPAPVKATRIIETPSLPEGERALGKPKPALSDKEIRDTAKYLLETNPRIRKGQAYFFASHCTLGRYYTIQDYKKYAKVAYETARTSMDNLAAEGFYRKEQVKNKFVYTPLKQGEEE